MQQLNSYTIVKGNYVIFKGELSPLSNFYKKPFFDDENEVQYPTMEHYFQHQKALFFNNIYAAATILEINKAVDVKHAARLITNFNEKAWDEVKDEIMLRGLKKKFMDVELKEFLKKHYINGNSRRIFLENTGHNYWGCRINNIFNTINPNHLGGNNKLGKLLNKVCEEFFDR
uniref:DUF1768 domain-containing protein n=1 Tax=Strongyloides papillosus TaxID=174720 RepID=A0A0N5C9K7_STREA